VLVWIGEAALGGADAGLDPRGEMHIPVGVANTLDSLKPSVSVGGRTVESTERGFLLPADTKEAHIQFGS
jgi:hypothetical protein